MLNSSFTKGDEDDMATLKEIREQFYKDCFATAVLGAEIVSAEPGKAVCRVALRRELCNAVGRPMGGAIFTLADFAFAVAANGCENDGRVTVSQQVSVTFLAATKGTELLAEAECIRSGRTTCLYQVRVTDDLGKLVAHFTVNGFTVGEGGGKIPGCKICEEA